MESKNIRVSKQQKELDRQISSMVAFGSNGFGVIPIAKTNIVSKDTQAELEHLTE